MKSCTPLKGKDKWKRIPYRWAVSRRVKDIERMKNYWMNCVLDQIKLAPKR